MIKKILGTVVVAATAVGVYAYFNNRKPQQENEYMEMDFDVFKQMKDQLDELVNQKIAKETELKTLLKAGDEQLLGDDKAHRIIELQDQIEYLESIIPDAEESYLIAKKALTKYRGLLNIFRKLNQTNNITDTDQKYFQDEHDFPLGTHPDWCRQGMEDIDVNQHDPEICFHDRKKA